jgi:glycosyltransferase involved in cell wall biosynthesis
MKQISVIIPNTDSLLIARILSSLKHQTLDPSCYEILVVGTDNPGQVIQDKQVQFLETDYAACASDKRNLGMRAAAGDIFLFTDDDCVPAADLLERHLLRHQKGEQIVGGAVIFGTSNYLQLADNISAFHDLLPCTAEGPRSYLATANLSVHRSVVQKAGEMPAGRNRAEDLEWTVRFRMLGFRLYFEPYALVFHDPPRCRLSSIWRHWAGDAHDTLKVRLRYNQLLQTPALAKYRSIYLWGAPLIAAWASARTFARRQIFLKYWHTLPLVYLTKLAWCWGAFTDFPRIQENA